MKRFSIFTGRFGSGRVIPGPTRPREQGSNSPGISHLHQRVSSKSRNSPPPVSRLHTISERHGALALGQRDPQFRVEFIWNLLADKVLEILGTAFGGGLVGKRRNDC